MVAGGQYPTYPQQAAPAVAGLVGAPPSIDHLLQQQHASGLISALPPATAAQQAGKSGMEGLGRLPNLSVTPPTTNVPPVLDVSVLLWGCLSLLV
jgi:hypothetical protein